MAKETKKTNTAENQQEEIKVAEVVEVTKATDEIEFSVLADIRLPALNMAAKKGETVKLTQAQAAFFIHTGQIKRKK